jgi:hypothetical protein
LLKVNGFVLPAVHTESGLKNVKGRAWTAAERDAGADAARKLTQEEPYPQSLYYRAGAKAGEPVLVTIPLRYAHVGANK